MTKQTTSLVIQVPPTDAPSLIKKEMLFNLVRPMWSATPAAHYALCWQFGHPAADCPKGPPNAQCCCICGDTAPKTALDTASDTAPEMTLDTMPNTAPETALDTAPDRVPAMTLGKAPNTARGRPPTSRITAGEQRDLEAARHGALQNIPDRILYCSRCG